MLLTGVFYVIFALSIQLTITVISFIPIKIGLLSLGVPGVYLMLILALICFTTAIGLYFQHEWAWLSALIICVLGIFNFWIGTLINIIFIVYMFQDRVKTLYNIEW